MKSLLFALVLCLAANASALMGGEATGPIIMPVAVAVKMKQAEVLSQVYAQLPLPQTLVLDLDNMKCVSQLIEMGDYEVGTCLITASAFQTQVVLQVSVSGSTNTVSTKVLETIIE